MKKVFRKTSLLLATALMGVTGMQAQKAPQDMDRFIDALMKKMTVEEKIGQLNLPVSGEIVTGQAQNSDVAKKIEQGWVGGLLNLKGVEKIRDVQKLAIEKSRLGIPLIFGMDVVHGYETIFPIPWREDCFVAMYHTIPNIRGIPGVISLWQVSVHRGSSLLLSG